MRRILSGKDVQVTAVGVSLTRPEDVLDVAGKGVGWTSGVAISMVGVSDFWLEGERKRRVRIGVIRDSRWQYLAEKLR